MARAGAPSIDVRAEGGEHPRCNYRPCGPEPNNYVPMARFDGLPLRGARVNEFFQRVPALPGMNSDWFDVITPWR